MSILLWESSAGLTGGVLSVLAWRLYDDWRMLRFARHYLPRPIVSTALPTLTELNRPEWIEEP